MRCVAVLLLSITTSAFGASAGREVWIPVAGRATSGDGRTFLTTVAITNTSDKPADATISYFPSASPQQQPRTLPLRLPPHATVTHELGAEVVPAKSPTGGLRIQATAPIVASARVHTGNVGGTFQAIPTDLAIGSGESTLVHGAGEPGTYRLYVMETRGHPLYFSVKLLDRNAKTVTYRRLYLSGFEQRNWAFHEPFTSMHIDGINGSGRIVAAGSLVDPVTRDVVPFEMLLPSRSRHRLPWPEVAAYSVAAAMLLAVAIWKKR